MADDRARLDLGRAAVSDDVAVPGDLEAGALRLAGVPCLLLRTVVHPANENREGHEEHEEQVDSVDVFANFAPFVVPTLTSEALRAPAAGLRLPVVSADRHGRASYTPSRSEDRRHGRS